MKLHSVIKMDTIFMNSEKSKTSEPHVLILNLNDKLDLRRGEKIIASSNLSSYYTWRNIKNSYNNSNFKIFVPTWNDKLELPDGSFSVSDIHGYSPELSTPEAMKLLGSTEDKTTKDKNGENVPHLEIT